MKYRISIARDRGLYSTTGAVEVRASRFPMIDCARQLLSRGADQSSTLAASTHEGGSVSPVALHRLVRAYHPPKTNHRAGDVGLNIDA
jgi:hypothetical protein